MVTSVEKALQTAEYRKEAIFGPADEPSLQMSPQGGFQHRALYGGFDIDPSELAEVSQRAGEWFARRAATFGLRALFAACWCDAFLVGLLAAQQSTSPPTTDPGDGMDTVTGEGCGRCIYCQHGQRCPWPDGPPEPREAE